MTQRTVTPAEAYQSFFGPAIFELLAEQVVAIADPRPEEDVLDVVCGTGIVTRRLAPAVAPDGTVVGVDLNPAMVVVVATWRGLDVHPSYAALADAEVPALEEIGLTADRGDVEAPFSLGDEGELGALLGEGGFTEVTVVRRSIDARFPDADRFVARMEHAYAAVVPASSRTPTCSRPTSTAPTAGPGTSSRRVGRIRGRRRPAG